MKAVFYLLLFALPAAAHAVAPASPASCRSVTRSPLGEHLRETVWEITRDRTKLSRALEEHAKHCRHAQGDLLETHELTKIEELAEEARKVNAELMDLEDEYLRTAQQAAEAAHMLRENDCQERIVEERRKMEHEIDRRAKVVNNALSQYCR